MRNRDDVIHIRILGKKFSLNFLYRVFHSRRDTLHGSADAKVVFGANRTVIVDVAFKRESLQWSRQRPGNLVDWELIESRSFRQRKEAFMNPATGRNLSSSEADRHAITGDRRTFK